MKLRWLITFFLFLIISPTYAYIEDQDADGTQLTAGEQNSNLYRLNSKGAVALKKLKKADEYIARNESRGKTVQASDLDDLLLSDEEDKQKQQMKMIMEQIKKQVSNPRKLQITVPSETYTVLQNMQSYSKKDTQAATDLYTKIVRRSL